MRYHSRSELGRLAMGLVALLTLPACSVSNYVAGETKPAGVTVKRHALDLAFGAEPAVAPVPRPRPQPPAQQPRIPRPQPGIPPVFEIPPPIIRVIPGPKDNSPCPRPGATAVAERPITTDVKSPIKAGSYTYQQKGTLDIVGLGKVPVSGVTTRTVAVTPGADGVVDYTVDYSTGLRRQKIGYRVDPADGIFLTSMETTVNGSTSSFRPLLPVEIFPLPAAELTTVTSAGLDPVTQTTMVVSGTVTEVVRVEGCGEVADGWKTDAQWTIQRPGEPAQLLDLEYVVAPQHGGLVLDEHVVTTERIGPLQVVVDVRTTFGSVHPEAAG